MRKLDSWVDGFVEYAQAVPSCDLWRKWAAISCVSAALERRCFIRAWNSQLYANLYIFLLGPPAAGKTRANQIARSFFSKLEKFHLAPSSVSRASLIDRLEEAVRNVVIPTENIVLNFNALYCIVNELGVFLPSYDAEFMATLTDLWDGFPYSEMKRTLETNIKIDKPLLSILASGTPSFVNSFLPDGAWEQGFMSRVIMVNGVPGALADIFGNNEINELLNNNLMSDLQSIAGINGQFVFTKEAETAFLAWYKNGQRPKPTHPKLINYCGRRAANLLKLCMVASASMSSKRSIGLEHYQTALDWLVEVENEMPEVFKAFHAASVDTILKDIWHTLYLRYVAKPVPIPEYVLITIIQSHQKVRAHEIMSVVNLLVQSKYIKPEIDPVSGKSYTPLKHSID